VEVNGTLGGVSLEVGGFRAQTEDGSHCDGWCVLYKACVV
jgi:hypothetical protein